MTFIGPWTMLWDPHFFNKTHKRKHVKILVQSKHSLISFPKKLETHIFSSTTRKIQNPLKPEPTPSPTHPIIQICLFLLSFCYLSSVVCHCLLSAVAAGCLRLRISGKHWIWISYIHSLSLSLSLSLSSLTWI